MARGPRRGQNQSFGSVAAYLANRGTGVSSGAAGDRFYHSGLGAFLQYDSVGSLWRCENPNAKYTSVDFTRLGEGGASGVAHGNLESGAAAAGTDQNINLYNFGGYLFRRYCEATSTVFSPTTAATGLTMAQDATADEGIEMYHSADAFGRMAFKIGTSAAFYVKAKLTIPDVSDYDVVTLGFRKAAAPADIASHAATITAYSDVAVLNMNAGNIFTGTRLNTGSGTLTDTTDDWADAATKTFEVLVGSTGVTTFKIDGVAPTITQTHTFDDTDWVIPFLHLTRAAADTAGEPTLITWECGLQ